MGLGSLLHKVFASDTENDRRQKTGRGRSKRVSPTSTEAPSFAPSRRTESVYSRNSRRSNGRRSPYEPSISSYRSQTNQSYRTPYDVRPASPSKQSVRSTAWSLQRAGTPTDTSRNQAKEPKKLTKARPHKDNDLDELEENYEPKRAPSILSRRSSIANSIRSFARRSSFTSDVERADRFASEPEPKPKRKTSLLGLGRKKEEQVVTKSIPRATYANPSIQRLAFTTALSNNVKTSWKHFRLRVHIDIPQSTPFTVEIDKNATIMQLKKAIYDTDRERGRNMIFPGLTGLGLATDLAHMRLYQTILPWEAWYQAKTFSEHWNKRIQLLAHFPSLLLSEDDTESTIATLWPNGIDPNAGEIHLLVRVLPFGPSTITLLCNILCGNDGTDAPPAMTVFEHAMSPILIDVDATKKVQTLKQALLQADGRNAVMLDRVTVYKIECDYEVSALASRQPLLCGIDDSRTAPMLMRDPAQTIGDFFPNPETCSNADVLQIVAYIHPSVVDRLAKRAESAEAPTYVYPAAPIVRTGPRSLHGSSSVDGLKVPGQGPGSRRGSSTSSRHVRKVTSLNDIQKMAFASNVLADTSYRGSRPSSRLSQRMDTLTSETMSEVGDEDDLSPGSQSLGRFTTVQHDSSSSHTQSSSGMLTPPGQEIQPFHSTVAGGYVQYEAPAPIKPQEYVHYGQPEYVQQVQQQVQQYIQYSQPAHGQVLAQGSQAVQAQHNAVQSSVHRSQQSVGSINSDMSSPGVLLTPEDGIFAAQQASHLNQHLQSQSNQHNQQLPYNDSHHSQYPAKQMQQMQAYESVLKHQPSVISMTVMEEEDDCCGMAM